MDTETRDVSETFKAWLIDDPNERYLSVGQVFFLAMTWCRPGEVQKAEWSEINLDEALWIIPAERMKMSRDHIIPLPRQAVELLKKVQIMSHVSKYVFPSSRTDARPMSDMTMVAAIRRMGYSKDQMCAHGFRAMASTIANEHPRFKRFSPDVIEKALAHSSGNKVRAAYNRALYLDERRELLQEYADFLDDLRTLK